MTISFKEWLDKEQPPSPNIWNYDTNADMQYFTNLDSKYSLMSKRNGQVKINPEDLYLCSKLKKRRDKRKK